MPPNSDCILESSGELLRYTKYLGLSPLPTDKLLKIFWHRAQAKVFFKALQVILMYSQN